REGRDDFEGVPHAASHERREVVEELTGAVRKRVSLQGAEGDRVYAVERAPDAGLGEQQQVASWEIDGLVGGSVVGHRVSGDAPVRAVDERDRNVHHREWFGRGIPQRLEEASQMRL